MCHSDFLQAIFFVKGTVLCVNVHYTYSYTIGHFNRRKCASFSQAILALGI